jgi:hypothetical protein
VLFTTTPGEKRETHVTDDFGDVAVLDAADLEVGADIIVVAEEGELLCGGRYSQSRHSRDEEQKGGDESETH